MNPGFHKLILVTHRQNIYLDKYLKFIYECAKSGITAVQLREKNLTYTELVDFGKQLQQILNPFNIPLIINDNFKLAYELNATGVHLGQSDGDVREARKLLGPKKIIGLTINSIEELYRANSLPINYIGVGAIYSTNNKSNVSAIWGCGGLKYIATFTSHPIVAIGGINENNVSNVIKAGANGIAAIGAFHFADNPQKTTQYLCNVIEKENINKIFRGALYVK